MDMAKNNQDVGEKCIKNDDGVLALSDKDKIAGKSCHKQLLNTEFSWDKNYLSEVDKVIDVLIKHDRQGHGEIVNQ